MNKYKIYFGVDIGGTKIALTMGEEHPNNIKIFEKHSFATIPNDPNKNIEKIVEILEIFQQKYGTPNAIGISCGSPLDIEKGIIHSPPNLPGWDDVKIVDKLREHFPVLVSIENDANACALAEFYYGAGRGTQNMIFLTFGTGLGGGLILNGRLYRGTNNNAGEVGHIRLASRGPVGYHKAGSFEGFCSGGGLKQLGQIKIKEHIIADTATRWAVVNEHNDQLSAKDIAQAAYEGDVIALEVMNECGEKFGEGLAMLIDILNPEMIVVGSIFARSGDLLISSMYKAIEREALNINATSCKILPARLNEQIGDFAALSVAHNSLKNNCDKQLREMVI